MFLIIFCIIIIILLAIELNNRTNELIKLKQENEILHENIYNMATKLNNKDPKVEKEKITVEEQQKEKIELPRKKELSQEPRTEKNHNNLILITGSIFIVLAAFLFLTSTWNVIPNVAKVIILFLLIFVFLGTSYFAKEKLKIEKTAKAFFYIAMIYIPIVFYSIAYLGLLGEYFSKTNIGFFPYLSVSSLITSAIYAMESKKEKKLLYANYLFQVIAIIFFGIFLNQGYELIYLLLTFYNLAILIKNIYCKTSSYSYHIELILTIILSIFLIINTMANVLLMQMLNEFSISLYLVLSLLILLGITFYRGKKESYIHALSSLLWIVATASVTTKLNLSLTIQEIIMLLTLIGVYLRSEFLQKNSQTLDWIILIISFVALFLVTVVTSQWLATIIVLTAIIINIYRYLKIKWDIHIALVIWLIALLYILFVNILELNYLTFIFLLTITEVVKQIIFNYIKQDSIKKTIEINSNIIVLPNLLYFTIKEVWINNSNMFLIPLIMIITSYINYKNSNQKYQLTITYLATAVFLATIHNILKLPISINLVFSIVVIISLIYKLWKKEKWKEETIFLGIYILSLISTFTLSKDIEYLFIILMILLALFHNQKYHQCKNINYLSYFFLTIILYGERINIGNIIVNPLISLIAIILWMVRGYLSKERETTDWLAVMYIIFDYIIYPINKYYTIIILILWCLANFDKKKKHYNIVKTIFYVNNLFLYNSIITDLQLTKITVVNMLGYYITLFLFTKTIIRAKDSQLANALEWGGSILLSMIAIINYRSEWDGILFVSLLIGMIIISYKKKIESAFLVSIIFIIINGFLLTREFWFSLPWWIYLLVIGFILILFATNNELQTNLKKKKILKQWHKYFKDEV